MTVNDGDESRAAPAPLRLRPVPTRRTISGLLPFLLAIFLLAGCGGEEEDEPLPGGLIPEADLSSPAAAMQTYARAVESASVSLMHDVMHEDDRPRHMRRMRDQIQAISVQGIQYRVEFDASSAVQTDDRAEVRAKYYVSRAGVEERLEQESYIVFLKTAAGEWKFSPTESGRRTQDWRNQQETDDNASEEPETPGENGSEGDPKPGPENEE